MYEPPTTSPLQIHSTIDNRGINPSPPSLTDLEAFRRAPASEGDSQAGVTALPSDMTIDMDNVNVSKFQ